MEHTEFFDNLWRVYNETAPKSAEIHQKLDKPRHDHVAFRSLGKGYLTVENLEVILKEMGFKIQSEYYFPKKKIRAKSFIHSNDVPKIFLSELFLQAFSPRFRKVIDKISLTERPELAQGPEIFYSGTPWDALSLDDYRILVNESEYAAWLLTNGMIPNHFAVDVNVLDKSIDEVLSLVESFGYEINTDETGARIYGSKELLLEQGSTIADIKEYKFSDSDEVLEVPTCFYEFTYRHIDESTGKLFQGFRTMNADKIFDSTNILSRDLGINHYI